MRQEVEFDIVEGERATGPTLRKCENRKIVNDIIPTESMTRWVFILWQGVSREKFG